MFLIFRIADQCSLTTWCIPGPQGAPDVRALMYQPKNAAVLTPALLWIHEGGYVPGSADQANAQLKSIIAATGYTAVAGDYRLAIGGAEIAPAGV